MTPDPARPTLVVGATGRVGGELIRLLVGTGRSVRALVRAGSDTTGRWPAAVETVRGDLRDSRSLDRATRGIGAAFVAIRDHPAQLEWEGNLIASLETSEPVPLVKVSAFAASLDPPPGYGRIHAAIEARLRDSRLPWTILQPYMYMQNFLEMAGAVRRLGRLPLPLGSGRVAFIDARDVARVAARVLGSVDHAGRTYVLTGGESLRGEDIAASMSAALQRHIAYLPVPPWLAGRLMRIAGVPAWDVAMREQLFAMLRRNGEARPNDRVRELSDSAPTSLHSFINDHRPVFAHAAC